MALKDWIEAITFLCRLSGSTMHRDTAKSRNTRKLLVTWKGTGRILWVCGLSLLATKAQLASGTRTGAAAGWRAP